MNDPWRLDGVVAVVTGAGRGLGRSCAVELAQAGASVVLVARTSSELETAADEAREAGSSSGPALVGRDRIIATPLVADVTSESEVERVLDAAAELGELRVLVTAAGANRPGPARGYSMDDWDLLFDINVRATFLACRGFGTRLLASGTPGSIITMSSQMGSVGYPGRVAYCATKHAVDGMTKAMAVEWARERVRVNAVAPTFVETPLTKPMLADPEFREEVLERRLPTGRLAHPCDVARAVRYLACDASDNVTGHVLRVDGGWTAW